MALLTLPSTNLCYDSAVDCCLSNGGYLLQLTVCILYCVTGILNFMEGGNLSVKLHSNRFFFVLDKVHVLKMNAGMFPVGFTD